MKTSIALSLVHFVLFEFKSAAEYVMLQNNNNYPETNLGIFFSFSWILGIAVIIIYWE